VIVQADPFSMPELEGDFRVTAEMPSERMGPGYWTWTSWWMSSCFGENAAKLLDKKLVLCSGTVMGTKQGVRPIKWHLRFCREKAKLRRAWLGLLCFRLTAIWSGCWMPCQC
jgi:hypothetical protein